MLQTTSVRLAALAVDASADGKRRLLDKPEPTGTEGSRILGKSHTEKGMQAVLTGAPGVDSQPDLCVDGLVRGRREQLIERSDQRA